MSKILMVTFLFILMLFLMWFTNIYLADIEMQMLFYCDD